MTRLIAAFTIGFVLAYAVLGTLETFGIVLK